MYISLSSKNKIKR